MKHYLPLFLLGFLFLSACTGSKKARIDNSTVNFKQSKTLSPLLEKAKLENKIVFVDFVTTWCLPCKMMDSDVYTDPNIAKFMNANFINYKVDAEKENGPLLSLVYEVEAYPTLVFVDYSGKVLVKKVGAAYQTELMSLAREALAMQEQL